MVSVVITTYNDGHLLPGAIKSVLQQSAAVDEVIVVDDGSTSSAAFEVTKHYQSKTSFLLRYHRKLNGGASSARNAGLRLAQSEFVAFLDADDRWLPGHIESKLPLLLACGENVFGVYGPFINSASGQAPRFLVSDSMPSSDLIGVTGGFPGGVSCYVFRRNALTLVGGFDESLRLNEDFDLILRLVAKGMECRGISEPGFVRTIRPGSLTRSQDFVLDYSSFIEFLRKAEENNYFSASELRRRYKWNELILAKRMKMAGEPVWKYRIPVSRAFRYSRPEGLREYVAYLISGLLRIIGRS